MKFIKTFDKFKINELFDSEEVKSEHEIDYLTKNIDTKELSKTKKSYSFRLNNLILKEIPFFKNGNPEVYPDMIIYKFGNFENTLVIVIGGYLVNTNYIKNAFDVRFYIEKNGVCLNPNDVGDFYDIDQLIDYLEGAVDVIKKQFDVQHPLTLN